MVSRFGGAPVCGDGEKIGPRLPSGPRVKHELFTVLRPVGPLNGTIKGCQLYRVRPIRIANPDLLVTGSC